MLGGVVDRWRWTVSERFTVQRSDGTIRGVVAIGDRTGPLPRVGDLCVITTDAGAIEATVVALEMLNTRKGHPHRDDIAGHEVGLLLSLLDKDSLPIGSVISSVIAS
jgi:hypothetical protein